MKIGERGQVTIPLEIRKRFGFLPNTDVEFVIQKGAVQLVPKRPSRRAAIDALYGKKKFRRSTNELLRLLRQ